ncbi:MAG TPA: 4-(cytidine 5'-diphospho)-2-C-methyl-D-erythritol kinase [Longimicrobiaceae bacterium]|nr:4-(cytidine 5'-diphospho)-2-C-methyl-D-erythritol kinase [Longimicrobiaceae bacterium]
MSVVRVEAPAKVNLRLRVLAREESGYHSLESLFCAVSLADTVEVRPGGPGVRLRVAGGVDTGPPERNLVVRAAERFGRELGREPALQVALTKRIPSAAGLGGGSSDAAAMLRALNALHGEPFGRAELLQMAAELGSDVPFFLCGSTLALGWGRGERLLALPALPPRPVLVAHPGVPMPTGEAFRRVAERRAGRTAPEAFAFGTELLGGWAGVCALAENDFEPAAFEQVPVLAAAKRAMQDAGALVCLLAGSGASLFGVFPSADERGEAEGRVGALGLATWTAETLASELPVVGQSGCDGE